VLLMLPDVALDIPLAPVLLTRICSQLLQAGLIDRQQLEAKLLTVEEECDGSILPREVISRCFQ